jgi:hypothetical protein
MSYPQGHGDDLISHDNRDRSQCRHSRESLKIARPKGLWDLAIGNISMIELKPVLKMLGERDLLDLASASGLVDPIAMPLANMDFRLTIDEVMLPEHSTDIEGLSENGELRTPHRIGDQRYRGDPGSLEYIETSPHIAVEIEGPKRSDPRGKTRSPASFSDKNICTPFRDVKPPHSGFFGRAGIVLRAIGVGFNPIQAVWTEERHTPREHSVLSYELRQIRRQLGPSGLKRLQPAAITTAIQVRLTSGKKASTPNG